MNFLSTLFRKQHAESVVLIDISATSVGGGYIECKEGEAPQFLYGTRTPIEARAGEPRENAMLRALEVLGKVLLSEGAPVLARATGSGSVHTVLASIDAPWQETIVRKERFEKKTPFTFTKAMVSTALEKTASEKPGKVLADESIIGSILNGYETKHPYGRRVHRASLVVLSSYLNETVARSIASNLRGLYHSKEVQLIAGSSMRYQAMHKAFPHESNALILDVGPLSLSVALVRRGLFVSLREISVNATDDDALISALHEELAAIATHYPLPRTIFLLTPEEDTRVRASLDSKKLWSLWLSENPPKIISVQSGHMTGLVQYSASESPDLHLLLMALYYDHCSTDGRAV